MKKLENVQMEVVYGGKWSWNCAAALTATVAACAGGALATVATSGVAVVGAIAGLASASAWAYDAC